MSVSTGREGDASDAGQRGEGDDTARLTDAVREAVSARTPLVITGAGTRACLGHDARGEPLSTRGHAGVITHEPTELVVTARAGTTVSSLVETLAAARQMMPFEPPDGGGTLGGVMACGLSGPRRPYVGSARDFVLGTRVVNGEGQVLRFGGEVMKNVAGYDVSRLQIGAFGTLGLLLDISMKVLPMPETEVTLHHELDTPDALASLVAMARQPIPLSASMVHGRDRYIRLSGSSVAVEKTVAELGGNRVDAGDTHWEDLRERRLPFFLDARPLWRLAVPEYVGILPIEGDWLYDWGGAQRWLKSDAPAASVFAAARASGGHATRYREVLPSAASDAASERGSETATPLFQPLEGPLAQVQSRLRDSFDPHRLFNRGRFHPELDMARQS